MFIVKISFFIIIILLILEIYFNYFNVISKDKIEEEAFTQNENAKENVEPTSIDNMNENFESIPSEEIIQFNNPNLWCKISINKNDYTKYYIKMNNFNEKIFLEWKKLIDSLDYDVNTKELILETKEEHEALALVNLIISNMNNDIKMDEIIDNKLITVSIQKAKTHKLVCNKLKELILENNRSLEDKQYESSIRYNTDFNEDNSEYENIEIELKHPINAIKPQEKVSSNYEESFSAPVQQQVDMFEPIPYGGSEFAFL